METNVNASLPVAIGYDVSPIDESDGTVYAVVVLVGLYVLIIFEAKQTAIKFRTPSQLLFFPPQVVHRTLAAILASTMSVAILAAFNEVYF
jgi:P protein